MASFGRAGFWLGAWGRGKKSVLGVKIDKWLWGRWLQCLKGDKNRPKPTKTDIETTKTDRKPT